MLDFQTAKRIILSGQSLDLSEINFDINQIDVETKYDFSDSNTCENEYTYTYKRTLLHIAIGCKNKNAITSLRQKNADTNINYEVKEERRQRYVIDGNSFFGGGNYSEWRDWEPEITTKSTLQLAQETKDAEIVTLISQEVVAVPQKAPVIQKQNQIGFPKYSSLFETLYDESEPTNVGRGCHYSIFRAKNYHLNLVYDFAVIWDEDHDTRIIPVLENLHKTNKLKYFIILGERKGMFTAILDPSVKQRSNFLPEFINAGEDQWSVSVLTLDKVGNGSLIQSIKKNSEEYISTILKKWQLGAKKNLKRKQPEPSPALHSIGGNSSEKIAKKSNIKEGRQIFLYGIPDKDDAREIEFEWEKEVVAKFFKVGRTLRKGKQSYDIYEKLINQMKSNNREPLNVAGYSRRSFIIALTKMLTKFKVVPELVFTLGSTIIKFVPRDPSSRKRQIGNFKLEIPGIIDISYGSGCLKRIAYLVEARWDNVTNNAERKKLLIEYIKNKLPTLSSFTYDMFNKYGNIRLSSEEVAAASDEKIQKSIHFLNGLIFLITIVEVLVRFYRTTNGSVYNYGNEDVEFSDSLPIAIIQARSLILLITGKISFNNFIGQTKLQNYDGDSHRAFFGAVTGKDTIDNIEMVSKKVDAINNEYNKLISTLDSWIGFTKEYLKSNPNGKIIEGRSRMYFDLKSIYGSGSESDEENTSYSDNDENITVSSTKSNLSIRNNKVSRKS